MTMKGDSDLSAADVAARLEQVRAVDKLMVALRQIRIEDVTPVVHPAALATVNVQRRCGRHHAA